MCKVQKKRCDYEKGVRTGKERDLMPRIQDRKKRRVVELGSSGMAYRNKSAAREEGKQSNLRRMFKMLKEIQLNIEVYKALDCNDFGLLLV